MTSANPLKNHRPTVVAGIVAMVSLFVVDPLAAPIAGQQGIGSSCAPTCYMVGDRAWIDLDGNGIQDSIEPGLPNVTVRLYEANASGEITDPIPIRTTITDQHGNYTIEPPPNQIYIIAFDPPPGFSPTQFYSATDQDQGTDDVLDSDPDKITRSTIQFLLDGFQNHGTWWDAGFQQSSCIEIGNLIWRDVEYDGEFDLGVDTPISGVLVELFQEAISVQGRFRTYGPVDSDITDANGHYSFDCVRPGVGHSIVVREMGFLVASEYYHPDLTNLVDNDNNFSTDPNLPIPNDSPGATNVFSIDPIHLNPDLTIDGGFACAANSINVSITIDTSYSMKDSIGAAKTAALGLVDMILSGQGATNNRVAIIDFAGTSTVRYPLGSNKVAAKQAINALALGSGTNLGDGIELAKNQLNGSPADVKAIILLSDGQPTEGSPSPEQHAIAKADSAKQQGIRMIAGKCSAL